MSQITTHILDTARGAPADGIKIVLSKLASDNKSWEEIGSGVTNSDGRVPGLCAADKLPAGTYQMHFATADYLQRTASSVFYPYADVVFNIGADGQHYHIPLLLSPFGYSTYRGS